MASSSAPKSRSPSSRSPSPSRILTSSDAQQGNILWLAPREETLASLRKRSQYASEPVHNVSIPGIVPDDGFYNHPILVVSRPSTLPDTIHFLNLTSFGGQKLEKRFRKGPSIANRRNYLTMAPGTDHPLFGAGDPMYRTLCLESGEAMERRGYVKISEVYSMNWRDAQPFWRGHASLRRKTRLDTASLRLLLFATQQIGQYSPGEQYREIVSGPGPSTFSSKSPTLGTATAAAAKAPRQLPSRRPSSLPERTTVPLSVAIPPIGTAVAPRVPQIARTTTAARTHPPKRRSPTASLPGDRERVWDEERQPLLPSRRNGRASTNDHAEGSANIFGKLFNGLKDAILGTFHFLWFMVRFIARIVFR